MIAAIYARFSTDRQRETSIEDQVDKSAQYIAGQGWVAGPVFRDSSTSGSTPVSHRAGGARLLAAALAGEFNALVLEGLDRLSRDLVEQETIIRNLEHAGIRIVGLADSYDTTSNTRKVPRIIRGMVNEIYIDDVREKTRRGLAGQVNRGYFAGGMPFGYRTVPDGNHGHRLNIDTDKADIVLQIFTAFAAGTSPRRIAHDLNARGIPSPRGGTWSVSAIYGQHNKSCGILANDIYQGVYIWNRTSWEKDPATGRRRRRDRPESEWLRRDMPELRIVPAALWNAAQARRARVRQYQYHSGGRARTLFGGLLRCGHCQGPVIAVNTREYGCGRHKDRGTCRPSLKVKRDTVEHVIIDFIRDNVISDVNARLLQKRLTEIMKTRRSTDAGRDLRQEIVQQERAISRLVDAIARSGWSEALNERLQTAEQQLAYIKGQLQAQTARAVPRIIPNLEKRFEAIRSNLLQHLQGDTERARELLHQVIGKVDIVEKRGNIYAEFEVSGHQILQSVAGSDVSIGGSGGALLVQRHRLLLLRRSITD